MTPGLICFGCKSKRRGPCRRVRQFSWGVGEIEDRSRGGWREGDWRGFLVEEESQCERAETAEVIDGEGDQHNMICVDGMDDGFRGGRVGCTSL